MADAENERLIDAWLDGELSLEQAAEVEHRLRSDALLRRQFGPMLELLASPKPVEVPDGLADRIKQAAANRLPGGDNTKTTRQPSYRVWLPRFAALAASLALVLTGWMSARWLLPDNGQTAPPGIPVPGSGQPTIVLSPWMVSSLAQGLATGHPGTPITFVVQGATLEVLAESPGLPASGSGEPPLQRIRQEAPTADESKQEPDERQMMLPLLVPFQKL